MKRFFKVIIYFIYFLSTTLSIIGFSFTSSNSSYKDALVASRYMYKNNLNHIVLTSRTESYPNYNNSGYNSIGNYFINNFAYNQQTFLCSMQDENITPFVIDDINLATPFLFLKEHIGDTEDRFEHFISLMFDHDYYQSDENINDIFISKSVAQKLLNNENPSIDDYQTLLNKEIVSTISKDNIKSKMQFKITNIIDDYKYPWMNEIYGEDLVVGRYTLGHRCALDNIRIHIIIENDLYSNTYYFSRSIYKLKYRYSHTVEFNVINNHTLEKNLILTKALNNLANKNVISIVVGSLLIVFSLLLLIGLGLYLFFTKCSFLKQNKLFPLIFSLCFSSSILFCSLLNKHLYLSSLPLFSVVGFIVTFSIYLILLVLYLIFSLKNKFSFDFNDK